MLRLAKPPMISRASPVTGRAERRTHPSPKMMKVDMKDLKSADVQALSDDDTKKIVTDGKGKMPAIKTVSGAVLDNLVS
jgi:hypothetical protein